MFKGVSRDGGEVKKTFIFFLCFLLAVPVGGRGDFEEQLMESVGKIAPLLQQQSLPQPRMQIPPPETTAADYFPECQIPKAMTFNENVCRGPEGQNPQILQMRIKQAEGQINFFRVHMAENLNTQQNNSQNLSGASCLDGGLKRRRDSFEGDSSVILGRLTQAQERIESYRLELAKKREGIDQLRQMIYGGGGEALKQKMGQTFSQGCWDLMGGRSEALKSSGLIKIKDFMQRPQSLANRFTNSKNEKAHEEAIKSQLEAIKNKIRRDGVEAWNPRQNYKNLGNKSAYAKIEALGIAKKMEYGQARENDKKKLEELKLGLSFSNINMEDSIDQIEADMVNQAMSVCLRDVEDKIKRTIRTVSGEAEGTFRSYMSQFNGIFNNSKLSPKQKEEELARLDENYNSQIGVPVGTGFSNKLVPPSGPFSQGIEKCEYEINERNATGPSISEKISKARRIIQEAQMREETFATEVYNALYEDIVNCNGESLMIESCNLDNMNNFLLPSGENFCVGRAKSCGQNINGCVSRIERELFRHSENLSTKVLEYNEGMGFIFDEQKANFNALKSSVLSKMGEITRGTPGTYKGPPQGLIFQDLTEVDIGNGVKLLGGNNPVGSFKTTFGSFWQIEKSCHSDKECRSEGFI